MAKVTTRIHEGALFETELGRHKVITDPTGIDGPSPPQILVASLGACVSVLVANYCRRTGIDTKGLSVDVTYDKASNPYRLADFQVDINLPDADIESRLKAIKRVAEHCPVHQTMCTLEGATIRVNGQSAQV